jgi:3-deoxy-manno-octulosonate cytidylyltransferase (CMP-KDO synthetase)
MVQHVHQRCVEAGVFSRILVATEDERIALAVRNFGGEAVMTSPDCASGTDRVAEVARAHPDVPFWVNVQGDEPLIHPEALRTLASCFEDPDVRMATLIRTLPDHEIGNPNMAKVVISEKGDALYFSRADIPYQRDSQAAPPARWAHLGLYAYRRDTLLQLAALPPTQVELTEMLEQLRALHHGIAIRCLQTPHAAFGVDTPDDLARAAKALCSSDAPIAPAREAEQSALHQVPSSEGAGRKVRRMPTFR